MCGIAGVAGLDDEQARRAVERALDRLGHRGPDARGTCTLSTGTVLCTLGHTRLRIIDTEPSADQPLANADESAWVIYNGELYNHLELRRELEGAGFSFRTRTDTEVLVHLYDHVGGDAAKMLERLRGMFAFALFDRRRGRVLLARDRLGIKPLYWAAPGGALVFASEVRALAATGLAGDGPDEEAVRSYLAWGVVQGPRTIFAGITALDAGSYLLWEHGQVSQQRWWRPEIAPVPMSHDEARERIEAVLLDSVGRHLVADRPVGVFLSSGIDSSAVAALAAKASADSVRTLTVALPGSGLDETEAAAAFAKQIGVEHERVEVEGFGVRHDLPEILAAMDQPTSDGVNTWLVSRAAHQAGLVVVLSGLGGDELFGGYPTFQLVPKAERLLRVIDRVPAAARAKASAWESSRRPGGRAVRLIDGSAGYPGAYRAVRGMFSATEIRPGRTMGADAGAGLSEGHALKPSDRVTLLELTGYQSNQLLRDTDQMSMAHSLEARVPLLDDAVVATCLTIPGEIRTLPGKQLLREAAGLPSHLTKRPFTLPFADWLRNDLRDTVRGALLSQDAALATLVPGELCRRVWEGFEGGRTHWSRPWALAMLRLWPQANGLSW